MITAGEIVSLQRFFFLCYRFVCVILKTHSGVASKLRVFDRVCQLPGNHIK